MHAKIRFGMPTMLELKGLDEHVSLCKELGLDFIELNMSLPEYNPERLDAEEVNEITKKTGIEFTLHLPDELDMASFNEPIRKGNIELFNQAILWARKAGIKIINIHLKKGTHVTLPDRKVQLYERYLEEYLTNIYNSFKPIMQSAHKNKIIICIENADNFHLTFIKAALERIIPLGACITWDVGHNALSGNKEKPMLKKYENRIRHIHLHDYDGKLDHQALFTGTAEVKEALDFAKKHSCTVLIETKTIAALRASVASLREKKLL
jgi:sugar phosphate isomerase/epimerase